MQFQAVPAGTSAAQALTIRGGDPEVEMTSNHNFNYFKMGGSGGQNRAGSAGLIPGRIGQDPWDPARS